MCVVHGPFVQKYKEIFFLLTTKFTKCSMHLQLEKRKDFLDNKMSLNIITAASYFTLMEVCRENTLHCKVFNPPL